MAVIQSGKVLTIEGSAGEDQIAHYGLPFPDDVTYVPLKTEEGVIGILAIEAIISDRNMIEMVTTLADLAAQLQVGVIMVVGMRLGCINHALLTAEAIAGDGLRLAGWVANQPAGDRMPCYQENLDTLGQLLPAPQLGEVPFLPTFCPAEAAGYLSMAPLLD